MTGRRRIVRWSEIAVPVAIAAVVCVIFVGPSGLTGIDPNEVGRAVLDGILPYRDFALEYPPGGALIFTIASLLAGPLGYRITFRALMALVWAALALLVARDSSDRRALWGFASATLAYSWVLPLTFDMVIALLAFVAWLAARRDRIVTSSAWLSLGIAVKWVTAPLIPFLFRAGRARAIAIACAFAGTGVLVGVVLPAAIAPEGADPLTYHRGRLPHAEGAVGSVIVISRVAAGEPGGIIHDHRSSGVVGAGGWANVLSLALVGILLLYLWLRCNRLDASTWAAALLGITALGPVASPQFLIWPLGFAGYLTRRSRALFIATGLASALYFALLEEFRATHPAPATVIVIRNMVAVACVLTLVRDARNGNLQTASRRDDNI